MQVGSFSWSVFTSTKDIFKKNLRGKSRFKNSQTYIVANSDFNKNEKKKDKTKQKKS